MDGEGALKIDSLAAAVPRRGRRDTAPAAAAATPPSTSAAASTPSSTAAAEMVWNLLLEARDGQGLTLVHCSAQLERCLWDRGCAWGWCCPC